MRYSKADANWLSFEIMYFVTDAGWFGSEIRDAVPG